MDNKTMLKVFGEAFLRSFVVMLLIVILGFAAFFGFQIYESKKADTAKQNTQEMTTEGTEELTSEEMTTEELTTEEMTTEEMTTEEIIEEEPQPISSADKKILILNSVGVAGIAKKWSDKISMAGFPNVAIGNYEVGRETRTTIYVPQEGMGLDLLEQFNDAEIVVGELEKDKYTLSQGFTADGVEIYVVIGTNDATVN